MARLVIIILFTLSMAPAAKAAICLPHDLMLWSILSERKGVPSFEFGEPRPPDVNGVRTQTFERTYDDKHTNTLTLYLHPNGMTCLGSGGLSKPEPTSDVPFVCMDVIRMLFGMTNLKLEAHPHTITFPDGVVMQIFVGPEINGRRRVAKVFHQTDGSVCLDMPPEEAAYFPQ